MELSIAAIDALAFKQITINGTARYKLVLFFDSSYSKSKIDTFYKPNTELNDQYKSLLKDKDFQKFEHYLKIEKPALKEFIKEKNEITLACLDSVTDPRNIGSLIRSAVSFNIDGIIIKERHFPNESKLMYKAASGAMEYMNIFEVSNINSTLKNLKDKNFWVYGFDGNGDENFTSIKWKGNNILLFGSESSGMHEHTSKYADFLVKIEIDNKIDSLNISNSAAIVFHHLSYLKNKI